MYTRGCIVIIKLIYTVWTARALSFEIKKKANIEAVHQVFKSKYWEHERNIVEGLHEKVICQDFLIQTACTKFGYVSQRLNSITLN